MMLPKIRTILYACDLEPQTTHTMEMVLNLAISNKAKVVLMHAMEPISAQASNMIHNYVSDTSVKEMREEATKSVLRRMQSYLSDFMVAHSEDLRNLPSTPSIVVVDGIPAEVIQSTAQKVEADLIVMNSRTHSRIGQMLIGSTANKVIHHSRIPVMVVPIIK